MTVRYEELIKNPDEEVLKIMKFVLDAESFSRDKIKHEIKTSGFSKWDEVLSEHEIKLVNKIISNLLTKLKYE